MSLATTEGHILQELMAKLEAEGYEVFIHPRPPIVPAFLESVAPDAIGFGKDKNIAIHVLRFRDDSKKLERIRALLQDQPNWELRVIWVRPSNVSPPIPIQSPSIIRGRIGEIEELKKAGHLGPAFLLGWASLEAAGRALTTDQFQVAQTATRIVEVLASTGYLTPSEADRLRELAKKRNAFSHGELQTDISDADVQNLIDVLRAILTLLEERQAT
jgi:hypothetical protein